MKWLKPLLLVVAVILAGCSTPQTGSSVDNTADMSTLDAIIASRADDQKARDDSRHPAQVIEFFGLKPGMRVAEVLPGGGWYTRILAPYVGPNGAIFGVNYADTLWALFGFFDDATIAKRIASMETFPQRVAEYSAVSIPSRGFAFGRIPAELNGSLDAVLLIRALHNLNRFEEQAGSRSQAIKEVYGLLKQGGIVGVVQHRAPETADDQWANGSNGYLKQSAVIAMFEQEGFELVASSEINANPKDMPGSEDFVWRLPPSLRTSPDKLAAMQAIGESDRMTLKFKKR